MIVLLLLIGLAQAQDVPRLSLSETLDLVVARNPDLEVASLQQQIARIDASRARLDRLTLNLSSQAGVGAGTVRAWGGATTDATSSSWDTRAALVVPIYAGGAIDASIDAADASSRISATDRALTSRDLERAAYTAYWTLKGYELQIGAAEEGLALTEESLAIIRAKADAGLSAGIDVNRAAVDALSQQEGLVADRAALYQAELDLLALLQLPGEHVVLVDDPPAPRTGDVRLPTDPGASRPELARAADEAALADASVRAARAGYRPTLSLAAESGLGTSLAPTSPAFDGAAAEPSFDASVGLNLSWNPFNLLQTRDAVQQAQLGTAVVEAATRGLRVSISAQVHQAAVQVNQLRQRAPLVAAQVALARDNLQIVQDLYGQGAATILDLFDAQSAFRQARIQEAALAVALAIAEEDLEWLQGAAPDTGASP